MANPIPTPLDANEDRRRAFWLEVRSAVSILESALNRRAQETKALELGLLGKCAGAIKGVLSTYLVLG